MASLRYAQDSLDRAARNFESSARSFEQAARSHSSGSYLESCRRNMEVDRAQMEAAQAQLLAAQSKHSVDHTTSRNFGAGGVASEELFSNGSLSKNSFGFKEIVFTGLALYLVVSISCSYLGIPDKFSNIAGVLAALAAISSLGGFFGKAFAIVTVIVLFTNQCAVTKPETSNAMTSPGSTAVATGRDSRRDGAASVPSATQSEPSPIATPVLVKASAVLPEVEECDLLTAHPDDSRRAARPVSREDRNPARALPACEAALRTEHSNPRIMFQLGLAHDSAKAHDKSAELYRRAAADGYAAALFALGWAHANGEGVERDDATAVHFYERAAAAGHAGAQNTLGFMHENGRGVPRDVAAAAQWYERAAASGRPVSQFNFGRMKAAGRGVGRDDDGAVRLYRAAMAAGRPDAALHLAILAEQGRAPQVSRAEMLFAFAQAETGADQRGRARRSLDAAVAKGLGEEVLHARDRAAKLSAGLEWQSQQDRAERDAAVAQVRRARLGTVSDASKMGQVN